MIVLQSSLKLYESNVSSNPLHTNYEFIIPHHNAFYPATYQFIQLALNLLCAVLVILHLFQPIPSKKVNNKLNQILSTIQISFYIIFIALRVINLDLVSYSMVDFKWTCEILLLVSSLSITLLIISSNPYGIPSIFWFFTSLEYLIIFLQDTLTDYPLLPLAGLDLEIQLFLKFCACFNSVILFLSHYQTCMFERITFSWLNPLIIKGYDQKHVSIQDIENMSISLDSEKYFQNLQTNWNSTTNYSLIKRLFHTFKWRFVLIISIQFLENILCFAQPILLKWLIQFFSHYDRLKNDPSLLQGFMISLAMFLVSLITTNLNNQFFMELYKTGLHIKGSLMALVYSKAMKLSQKSRLDKPTGDIINLVSIDVSRVQNLSQQIHLIVGIPTKILFSIIALYSLMGHAVLAGFVIVLVMIPINTMLLRLLKRLSQMQMKHKDTRLKLISETLNAIKCVKLYNWEFSMLKNIESIRNDFELVNLKRIGMFISINKLLWSLIPLLISISTFYCYNAPLTSDIVFPALSLFNIFTAPVLQLPSLITCLIEASIALNRLTDYLACDEVLPGCDRTQKKPLVNIENCTFLRELPSVNNKDESMLFSESSSSQRTALYDISINIKPAEFCCIVGPVGSGKSTLLNAIIGELPLSNNCKMNIAGSMAYCSQIPWILNTSLKENILFGSSFDQDYYLKTLDACDLLNDIAIFPNGDNTLVGEKGISLSGGQRARVSLARAVYARKDVYILDDVLSAVDSHVANKIITKVLSNTTGLLRNSIRILATNTLTVLNHADRIVCLEQGRIVENVSLDSVSEISSPYVYNLVTSVKQSFEDPCELDDVSSLEVDSPESSENSSICSASSVSSLDTVEEPKRIVKKVMETSCNGGIKWTTYYQYAKSCSLWGIVLFLTMIIVSSSFQLLSNYWLKDWSEKNDISRENPLVNTQTTRFILIYFLLGLSSSFFVFMKTFILYQCCSIKASYNLHNSMIKAILKSPILFFDTTPVGRILNRFSNDINKIDESLPKTFIKFFTSIVSTVFTLGILIYHLPIFVFPVLLLGLIYYYYQVYYIVASRDLKRIGSTSRSPIFNHLQESLYGAETIRCYRKVNEFQQLNQDHINFNLKALYIFRSVNRWLSCRLQLIGALVIFLFSSLALYSLTTSRPLTNGIVGLIMGYSLEITESLNSIVRSSVEIETNIVCAERVLEYSNLKSEAPFEIPENPKPQNWPLQGKLRLNKYTTKYRDDQMPVLEDITCDINANEKIGIVGRTGAGKSTLALALFRLIESTNGNISIDNLNIETLGLNDLRSSLSIIPQDCLAFEGTVRDNLDPLKKHSDEELLKAIKLSHLQSHLETLMHRQIIHYNHHQQKNAILHLKISEGGRNLSVGQRQLLCLARALLNPSKVLILDEATAAVDAATDKIIQETIRTEFANKTILTIAHRLDTVLDSDKILVLDYGKVVEFDSPKALLSDKTSSFYKLYQQAGCIELS